MKRIISVVLLCIFVLGFACACGKKQSQNNSSTNAVTENSSTITTNSDVMSETASESENSSDNSSNKEEDSSQKPTSSKANITRPGTSSNSQSVKVSPLDRKCVVMCGLSTDTANSYGTSREAALSEIADIAAAGYINSLSDRGNIKKDDWWEVVIKYDLTVWYSEFALYDSSKVQADGTKLTIDEHFKTLYDTIDNYVKPYPERWERFNGFWFDEHIWRGETNADFVTVTKTLYQKYGKRLYAVVATGEISGVEGNEDLIGTSAENMKKMLGSSFKYVTDAGFDSYGIDVREGALNGDIKHRYEEEMPGIYDGKSYYREYTELITRLVDHNFNLWYLPCAYTCSVAGGLDGIKKADEGYCLGHLEFFYNELENKRYAGGLMLYVYGLSEKSENNGTRGLKYHLVVENGDYASEDIYKLHPETDKWKRYSEKLRWVVKKYNSQEVPLLKKL